LDRALEELDELLLGYVPQAMFNVDKVVTRVDVAIVFNDRDVPAGRTEDTQ
jgi:hypothetical protein